MAAPRLSQMADAGGHQEGDHRHRSDRQLPGSAEEGIYQQRHHRGIEADDRRQAGQQGVGHPLRDEHHCHSQAGSQVAFPVINIIAQ